MSSTPRPWPGTQIIVATGALAGGRHQHACQHALTRPALEDDLPRRSAGNRRDSSTTGRSGVRSDGNPPQELRDSRVQRLLPGLGFGARAGLKAKPARRGSVFAADVGNRIEPAIGNVLLDAGERPVIEARASGRRVETRAMPRGRRQDGRGRDETSCAWGGSAGALYHQHSSTLRSRSRPATRSDSSGGSPLIRRRRVSARRVLPLRETS